VLEQKEEPPEPEEMEEPKKKPNPTERIEKYLGLLERLVGEDQTRDKWVTMLGHSDNSAGALSLDEVKKRCNVSQLWALSGELKDTYLATKELMEREGE
jgi:hypothetical protein